MTEEEDVANRSLVLAEKYLREGKPGRSFAHLLIVLKLKPQLKDKLIHLFITALCSWDKYLVVEGRYSDLFACYEQALEHYKHHTIYSSLGTHLYRLNYKNEAIQYFQLALRVNNEYLPALKNLYNLFNESVERWHFRMLNDDNRNQSFRKAISNKLKKGHKSILDIGTGTGLLSIYTKLEGAEKIYGCDYSHIMIDMANKVIYSNVDPDSVVLISKLSNDISIPEDIPCRCSLLVTETVDAGIFGERILQTLIHAWENLLLPKNLNDRIHSEVIPQSATIYVALIQCLKVARMNYLLGKERCKGNVIKMEKIKLCSRKTEPYDTENLRLVKYECLSDPMKILKINFNNVEELKEMLNNDKIIPDLVIRCNQKGFVDALAMWFDLHLDDTITVSSSPNSSSRCCWDQTIFPLKEAYFVQESSYINIRVGCKNGELRAIISNINDSVQNLLQVPQEVIRFLNCITLQTTFQIAITKLKNSEHSTEINEMLDLSPFPVMGFLFAQHFNTRVTSVTEISKELSNILSENNIESCFENSSWDEFMKSAEISAHKFDVIILNYLKNTGEFHEELINNLPKIRQCIKPEAVIIPSQLGICCKLVNSEQLINESEVTNPLLMTEIKLAEYINIYKVPYHIDFKMDEVIYESLSQEFIIGQLNIESLATIEENIVFEKEVQIIDEGYLNAILIWYEFDIFGFKFSTNVSDSYVNQIAWLLTPSIAVKKSDVIKVKGLYNQSFLTFSCIKLEK